MSQSSYVPHVGVGMTSATYSGGGFPTPAQGLAVALLDGSASYIKWQLLAAVTNATDIYKYEAP